jgi:hypothetical protein
MADDLEQIRQTMPDLARLDPLSAEVREWLDNAHRAVRQVDQAEGVIFSMHQRYLLDPSEKIIASAEIAESISRTARTRAVLRRSGVRGSLT